MFLLLFDRVTILWSPTYSPFNCHQVQVAKGPKSPMRTRRTSKRRRKKGLGRKRKKTKSRQTQVKRRRRQKDQKLLWRLR